SMANAPHDDEYVQLHVRHVPGGSFTDHVFRTMKERDILRLEGPFGTFFLRDESDKPIVLVASGTGFAPIKALIEAAFKKGVVRPMRLYWGARRPKDLYLNGLAERWVAEHASFEYVPVISDALPEDKWDGRSGCVHRAVMEDLSDLSGHQVYACGVPDARRIQGEEARPAHEGAADGEHLLLAPGQRAGGLAAPLREPRKQLESARAVGGDPGVGPGVGSHREIFLDAQLGEHPASLGHHDEPGPGARERGDSGEITAAEPYRPRSNRRKPGDGAQRRGLARAVGADQADEFARGDFEIDPLHRADSAVADFQAANFEQLHAGGAVATPR